VSSGRAARIARPREDNVPAAERTLERVCVPGAGANAALRCRWAAGRPIEIERARSVTGALALFAKSFVVESLRLRETSACSYLHDLVVAVAVVTGE